MASIVRIRYRLVPQQDVVVQPVTSKVVKQVILEATSEPTIHELLSKKSNLRGAPEKPIKLSMLRDPNNRYLWGDGSRPITLRAGAEYFFDVTYIDSPMNTRFGTNYDPYKVVNALMGVKGLYTLYKLASVYVEPTGPAKVVPSEELGRGLIDADRVELVFKTPTLLQYPKPKSLRHRVSVNALWPDPALIILSLTRKWNTYETNNLISQYLAHFAPYELEVIDHSIRPVTVQVGKTKERGFIGWVVLRVNTDSKKRLNDYLKLLDFARYAGIGRSTTLGLGTVKLAVAKEGKPLKDQE